MFHAVMAAAIGEARTRAQLDDLSRRLWQGWGSGALTDAEAQALGERLEARRRPVADSIVPVGIPAGRPSLFPPKRPILSPDRAASRARRRQLACTGPLPPAISARFTEGQRAVLKIVADEIAARGVCGLCLDAIAARAGVCRRLAQGALRLAASDGLLSIEERRREGRKNDTNLVRIISREWSAWIKRGRRASASILAAPGELSIGCKRIHPTDTGVKSGQNKPDDRNRNGFAVRSLCAARRERAERMPE